MVLPALQPNVSSPSVAPPVSVCSCLPTLVAFLEFVLLEGSEFEVWYD